MGNAISACRGNIIALAQVQSTRTSATMLRFHTRILRGCRLAFLGGNIGQVNDNTCILIPRAQVNIGAGSVSYESTRSWVARHVSLRTDRYQVWPPGVDGGKPGRGRACWINPGTPDERSLSFRVGDILVQPGDIFRVEDLGRPGQSNRTRPWARVARRTRRVFDARGCNARLLCGGDERSRRVASG